MGRYFEAHDAWEHLWRESAGDDKLFIQALIQVAAAGVHIARGNAAPAKRLLALAAEKLVRFGDDEAGVNVDFLRRAIEAALPLPPAELLRANLRSLFPV